MYYDNYDLWWDDEPTDEQVLALEDEANELVASLQE